MKAVRIFFSLLLLLPCVINAQEIIDLYPGAIPNSRASKIEENRGMPSSGMFNRVKHQHWKSICLKKKKLRVQPSSFVQVVVIE